MAEDEKKVSEDANLNWDEVKTTYSAEEVKEMQSNSEKGVQKLITEKKANERAMKSINKIVEDKGYLIELYETDEEAAKIILTDIYDGQSIEDFKTAIEFKEDMSDPKVIERLVEKKAKEHASISKIANSKLEFIEKFKLEWDELKEFEEAFEERMELKSFSANNVDNHLEKALREISDDKLSDRLKSQKEIAKTMATWEWATGWTVKKDNSIQKQSNDFLKKFGVI